MIKMKILKGFGIAGKYLKTPVLTWGVFDGVHRGHQSLIKAGVRWAKKIGTSSLVITFDNHPDRVLHAQRKPLFIVSLAHRMLLLKQLRVDAILLLHFTRRVSLLSAGGFISRIIRDLKPAGIVVTDKVTFGRKRSGNIRTLRQALRQHSIPLRIIKPLKNKGRIISSSFIRRAIERGELGTAQKMLGRPVTILGTVVRGSGRGAKLGFPTANLNPHHEILPKRGVYSARVFRPSCRNPDFSFKAAVNIGINPTFNKSAQCYRENIEVFLLGYDAKKYGSLYGQDILVKLIRYLRPEKKFSSIEMLTSQIRKDIQQVE
jgi:riboflavin kinase/FMN adenylyltransferase